VNTRPAASNGHVTVVGAGAVGVCCALYLQREGLAVRLIDRGAIGGAASRSNAGLICTDDCIPLATPAVLRRVPGMLLDPLSPLAIRWSYLPAITPWLYQFIRASTPERMEQISIALMSLLDGALDAYRCLLAEADATDLIRNSGLLYIYGSERAFADDQFAMDLRRRRGVQFEVLDQREVAELEPMLAGRSVRGVYCPGSGFTSNPHRLVGALADHFLRSGGEFVSADVLGFEVIDDRVTSLLTTGGFYPVDQVVVAAGAWSRTLVQELGLDVPLDTERGYLMVLPNAGVQPRLPFLVVDRHIGVTPTEDGLRLAGGVELAGLRAQPNLKRADALLRGVMPFLGDIGTRGAARWMSFRPSMPDSMPVIGWAPRPLGAFFAFGHGHLGLSLAAITGRLVAETMIGGQASVDITPFRPDRWRGAS
jgi:D-amino-acid dehydrogenase